MNIRKATYEDVDRQMEIYAYARKFMAEHENPNQWGKDNWPPRELIEQDIEAGTGYVCEEDGKVIGTFYFDKGIEPESDYTVIENGHWIGENTYGVVHRIAGDGSVKGIGSFCINWAFDQCGHLRMDTHEDNYVMQNLLKKNGFVYCGIIYLKKKHEPRLAYERVK